MQKTGFHDDKKGKGDESLDYLGAENVHVVDSKALLSGPQYMETQAQQGYMLYVTR